MPEKNDKYKLDITPELIEKYFSGQLDGKTMHAIEKQALNDPFLSEALEGFSLRDPHQSKHLAALQEQLNKRLKVHKKEPEPKAFLIKYRNSQIAAAAVLLILISAGIFFHARKKPSPANMVALQNIPPGMKEPGNKLQVLPKDTSSASPRISENNSDVSQKVTANIPQKIAPAGLAAKKVWAPKKQGIPITQPKPENNIDTLQVMAFSARHKQSITGSVKVISEPDSSPFPILLTGKIHDAEEHYPLAGVTVIVPGTHTGTVSDISGRFHLPLAAKPESLRFAMIGYQSKEIAVNHARKNFDISMKPAHNALNETVVVGYSRKKQESLQETAYPVGGFAAFKQYIKDSLHYPEEARRKNLTGIVKISFMVMPDSTLRQIKVVNGLGHGCDSEAVRLLREGPQWIPAKSNKASKETIQVRFSSPGAGK